MLNLNEKDVLLAVRDVVETWWTLYIYLKLHALKW